MSNNKEAVTLVVITFLLVILIYSSVAKFEVFARPPATASSCVDTKPTKAGAVYAQRCCSTTTFFNNVGRPIYSYTSCQVCEYGGGGSLIGDCSEPFKTGNTGGLNPPPSVGPEQPLSPTPPPRNTLPPSSTLQQTTPTTCPNGLAPDANGNCPTTTTSSPQQPTPPSTTSTQHHHKGSNLLGGQQLTTKKGNNNNNNDNSPTPPECPKGNEPIPPNCTLKPIK